MNSALHWAWTLTPPFTLALADTGEAGTGILWFSGWPELIAVVLLGAGFIILVGTLGAMWKNRWRDPMRDVASSRLDRPSSLEMENNDAPAQPVGVVYSRGNTPAPAPQPEMDAAPRVMVARSSPDFIGPSTSSDRGDAPASKHFMPAGPHTKPQAATHSNGSTARAAAALPPPSPPAPPTVDEAQRLLDLMNQAEDQAARLNTHFDQREAALRSLITEADGKLEQLRAAEQAAATPAPRPAHSPAFAPVSPFAQAPSPSHAPSHSQSPPPSHSPSQLPVVTTVSRQAAPAMLATAAALHSGPHASRSEHRPQAATQTRVHADTVPTTPITPTLIAADPAGPDPLTGEIYRLADQGMPHIEIARRLNQHVGKVELILALRPG